MNHLITWLVCALIAVGTAGFTPVDQISTFNQTRVLELVLLLIASSYLVVPNRLLHRLPHPLHVLNRKTTLIAATFWALGFISCIQSEWPPYALLDWAQYLLLTLSAIAIATLASQNLHHTVKILTAGIALGIGLALTRLIIQIIFTFSMNVVTPLTQWWQPYANPRFIAQALVWIIPLLAVLPALWPTFQRRSRIVMYAISSGAWLLLFWTGSRAELLSLVLSMGLVAALMWRHAFSFLAQISLHALTGFVLWLLTRTVLSINVGGADSLSLARFGVSGRDWLVERSLQLDAQHPWLGVGPAHFSAYNHYSAVPSAHPHNLILQIASEWGLPAAALLIYLLWKFVRRQYQSAQYPLTNFDSASNLRHALQIPLLVTLFAVILTSMLDGIHVMPLSELIGVPVLGLMIAINRSHVVDSSFPCRRESSFRNGSIEKKSWIPACAGMTDLCRISLGKLIAALLIFCWGIMLFSIFQQRDCLTYPIRAEQLIKGQVGYDNPRFWVQGRIPLGEGCTEIGRYQNGLDTLTGQSVDAPSTTEQYWR